jgi:hypothetical protein
MERISLNKMNKSMDKIQVCRLLRIVVFGIGLALAGAGTAAAADPASGAADGLPELAVESKVYEFGVRWSGEELRHAFVLHNTGDGDLKIERIAPG